MSAPPPQQIRVLIVDDSAFMRKALTMMLESDPQIKVVGSAHNGEEGVARVRQLKPDLVTMDIEMPGMNGLAALRQIMADNPVPVMMISSVTTDGAEATLQALDLGAVDFIPKQMSYVSLDIVKIKDDLLAKIKDIARRKNILMTRFRQRQAAARQRMSEGIAVASCKPAGGIPSAARRQHQIDVVTIGSSTGGPPALQAIIPLLPRSFPVGIAIAQHMPPMFTRSLAERLDGLSQVSVREAVDGEPLEPGNVLIAPGGRHLQVRKFGGRIHAVVTDQPASTLFRPCVDVLFSSVAAQCGSAGMAVVLTGMGSNGLEGARQLKARGGVLIAQNEETCVVFGMPRAVIEARLTDHVAPVDSIASEIASYF